MKYKTLKEIFEIGIQVILLTLGLCFFGLSPVYAQVTPFVDFTPDKLFEEVNFLPGDIAEGVVDVANRTGEAQEIITEATNITDNEGLSSALVLTIKQGSVILYQDTFDDFLSSGEILLSPISIGGGVTYTYTIVFGEEVTNYQGATLGFDICVGFLGGSMNCGETEISEESDTEEVIPIASSSGGGGGGGDYLRILNERVTEKTIEPLGGGTVMVEWNTNIWATGQVVYGPASGHYALDMNDSRFGYPFASLEVTSKTRDHKILLTGIDVDMVYKYRVISRASPATVSHQHIFAVMPVGGSIDLNDIIFDGESVGSDYYKYGGEVDTFDTTHQLAALSSTQGSLDIEQDNSIEVDKGQSDDKEGADTEERQTEGGVVYNTASVFEMIPHELEGLFECTVALIMSILVIIMFVYIMTKNVYDEDNTKHLLSWMFGVIVAIVIMYILDYTCAIWALLVIFVLLFTVYLAKRNNHK